MNIPIPIASESPCRSTTYTISLRLSLTGLTRMLYLSVTKEGSRRSSDVGATDLLLVSL